MSDMNMSLGCDDAAQLMIVDDLDVVPARFISGQSGFISGQSGFISGPTGFSLSPPPLIGLDRPGPPNMAVLTSNLRFCRSVITVQPFELSNQTTSQELFVVTIEMSTN